MKVSNWSGAPNYYDLAGNLRTGNRDSRVLLTGEEDSPDNFRFTYGEGADSGNWTTPRHHHNFEQVRHPLEGNYSIAGEKMLPAGWVAYFPESAYYGPQTLESNLKNVTLQFGSPSGYGFPSVAQRRHGLDLLNEKGGTLNDGMYTWTDEQGQRHNQDAAEAAWEVIYNRKMVYPPPRYDSLIIMNPASFEWIKSEDFSGVGRKMLGTFTEREIKIEFFHLDAKSKIKIGTEHAPEILFLEEGAISYGGETHQRLSAFGTGKRDAPEEITAIEESLLFYIKLPTF